MEFTPQELKIVVVEDNAALADIYKTRLNIVGYKCYVANDGEEAIKMIKEKQPNLVLLDLMMPKVSGDEVLRVMRANEWGKNIRVFVISNLNESEAPGDLRELGISGYVVKANLSDDQLDQLVMDVLTPDTQDDDGSLENPGTQTL